MVGGGGKQLMRRFSPWRLPSLEQRRFWRRKATADRTPGRGEDLRASNAEETGWARRTRSTWSKATAHRGQSIDRHVVPDRLPRLPRISLGSLQDPSTSRAAKQQVGLSLEGTIHTTQYNVPSAKCRTCWQSTHLAREGLDQCECICKRQRAKGEGQSQL